MFAGALAESYARMLAGTFEKKEFGPGVFVNGVHAPAGAVKTDVGISEY